MLLLDFAEKAKDILEFLSNESPVVSWSIIGAILFLTGLGFPSPEDIWLTGAGFLLFGSGFFGLRDGDPGFNFTHYAVGLLFCSTCNVLGDSCCWWLGKNYGLRIRDKFKFFRKLITDDRLLKVEGWYAKYGSFTVFIGRQAAGLRLVTFFTAGVVRMSLPKFMLWDFIGCFVSIPVWFTLGSMGYHYQDQIIDWMATAGTGFLLGTLALVVIAIVYFKLIRPRTKLAQKVNLAEIGRKHHEEVVQHDIEKASKRLHAVKAPSNPAIKPVASGAEAKPGA